MRGLLSAVILALALFGCATFKQYFEPVSSVDPKVCAALPEVGKSVCKEAGDAILKGYATLAGYNKKIADKKDAGIYTQAQAQALLDKSIEARKDIDRARDVFLNGDYAGALSQVNLTNKLFEVLEKELAKAAKETK